MKAILKTTLVFLLVLSSGMVWAQGAFKFPENRVQDRVNFKLINNLILLPVVVNNVPLNFLLDTGAASTVIFSLEEVDAVELYNYTMIKLRGLGEGEPVDALKSEGNTIQIGNAVGANQTIYVIFDGALNFSSRLGYPVHGIIGYDFLKDFVVEINNTRERMRFFLPEHHKKRRCRSCIEKALVFKSGKPYITANFIDNDIQMEVNLLIDSGSGDGLWLFENSDENITVPQNAFEDYLGLGISGNIYGKRSKVDVFAISDFRLENVNTAFPDVDFLDVIENMGNRNGSVGGEILKRFNWTIDYSGKYIRLQKNRYFNRPFHYNMSGLTLEQGGFVAVKEEKRVPSSTVYGRNTNESTSAFSSIDLNPNVELQLKQLFEVVEVRKNSPAYLAGIRVGDEILEVNGKRAYRYDLNGVNQLFYRREGRTIRMKILRNGIEHNVRFELEDL